MKILNSLLPFLRWFPMSKTTLRADFIAGITVALILVPQSMAYAQLAGLPVVYGLYASFIPVIIASLWGSSNQLHTGPVAMLSLMSAAAVMSYATPGTTDFIEISLMLALMVGILRLALGVFRLGAIVNLLSSPVIIGFTNAAALIIGFSQLSKVIGVPFPRSDSYLLDLSNVFEQLPEVHWWTLIFAAGAWVLISALRKINAALPGVLIAVAVATLLSGLFGFENKISVSPSLIQDQAAVKSIEMYSKSKQEIAQLTTSIANNNAQAKKLEEKGGVENIGHAQTLLAKSNVYKYQLEQLKSENNNRLIELHGMTYQGMIENESLVALYPSSAIPANIKMDNQTWRFNKVEDNKIVLSSGGAVVGYIPKGLPSFKAPTIRWDLVLSLLPAALVMALIGFMEATSISKAIATTTGERVDTSKELIGQGLANITGSFFGSYTVSGSFSRSAVAAKTGAKTGLFAIISALSVVLVLLFFTTYLYHLPQAVLAVIVMMAVFSLIRIKPLIHAWKIDRPGAIIGIMTFLATLIMAPAIADGILLGIVLTILASLISTMKPRVEVLGLKKDGTLGGIKSHKLEPVSPYFVPVRFDGSLTFVNVAYFEDMILEAHADFPEATTIMVVGSGINDIDASGEEKIREVAKHLREAGVNLIFSSLKNQVMRVLEESGVVKELGKYAFYASKATAFNALKAAHDSALKYECYEEEKQKDE